MSRLHWTTTFLLLRPPFTLSVLRFLQTAVQLFSRQRRYRQQPRLQKSLRQMRKPTRLLQGLFRLNGIMTVPHVSIIRSEMRLAIHTFRTERFSQTVPPAMLMISIFSWDMTLTTPTVITIRLPVKMSVRATIPAQVMYL